MKTLKCYLTHRKYYKNNNKDNNLLLLLSFASYREVLHLSFGPYNRSGGLIITPYFTDEGFTSI